MTTLYKGGNRKDACH